MTTNKPAHSVSIGTIQATIWENVTDLGTFYRLGLAHCYRKDDTWATSRYFGEYDLDSLIQAIQECQNWIQNHKKPEAAVLSFPKVENEDEETPPVEN